MEDSTVNSSVSKSLVNYELECTVCLEFPLSPIYNCENGHILCGLCFKQVKKCALCQKELITCGLAERMVRREDYRLPCRNNNSGCKEQIKSTEMIEHLEKCSYRLTQCFEEKAEGCSRDFLQPLDNLYRHLLTVHHTQNLNKNLRTNKFSSVSNIIRMPDSNYKRYPVQSIEDHGKVFLLHTVYESPNFYWWVTVIGGLEESKDFDYSIKLVVAPNLRKDYSERMNFIWELPVLPVNNHTDLIDVRNAGKFVSLHQSILERLLEQIPTKLESEVPVDGEQRWWLDIEIKLQNKNRVFSFRGNPFSLKVGNKTDTNFCFPQSKDEPRRLILLNHRRSRLTVKTEEKGKLFPKFVTETGIDTIMRNGGSVPITTRMQSNISNNSFEENPFEYYQLNSSRFLFGPKYFSSKFVTDANCLLLKTPLPTFGNTSSTQDELSLNPLRFNQLSLGTQIESQINQSKFVPANINNVSSQEMSRKLVDEQILDAQIPSAQLNRDTRPLVDKKSVDDTFIFPPLYDSDEDL